jgi:hypothetical protein
VLGMTKEN